MTKQTGAPKRTRDIRNTPEPTLETDANGTQASQIEYPAAAKPLTKLQQVIDLLVSDQGATLDQMIAATGWLPHTTRAALTGLKKRGYAISSVKLDQVRTYRAVSPQ